MSRSMLLADGVPADTIASWLRRGRLERVLPSVYARPPADFLVRVSAALLWLPAAAASHRSAAWLWQLTGRPDLAEPDVVELTTPRRCSRRSPVPWLRIYRRDRPSERVELCGQLRAVAPEQALLDCLDVLDEGAGVLMLDSALGRQLRGASLRERFMSNVGRRGSPAARRIVPFAVPGAASHPERVLARALTVAGVTGFRVNQPVRGYVADLLDRERRLIVEVDGWSAHGSRMAFQHDRTRQNALVAAGYLVLRYTASDVEHRLGEVVAQIRAVVADRG